jgi:hypothetical protein
MTVHISLEDGQIMLKHAVSPNKGKNFYDVWRFVTAEGESNANLKSAIKIRTTARLSCKLTTMILMV